MAEYFLRPYLLVLLLLAAPIVFGWVRRQIKLRHSSLAPHKGMASRSVIVAIAGLCLLGMTGSLVLSMMGPRVPDAVVEHKAVIRKVCIQVDRSGSMTTTLDDGVKELTDDEAAQSNDPNAVKIDNGGSDKVNVQSPLKKDEPPHPLTRAEGAQLAARYIIRHRMSENPDETDQFCLMSFDDDTYMMAPLTNDKKVLMMRTVHITENVGGGTNFAGPYGYVTGIGPLQKASDYFAKNASPDSVSVVIMITDGYDSMPEDRARQLLELFQRGHLRFYIIGLGDGWKEGNTLDLQKWADKLHAQDPSNGIVFRASNPGDMQKAMERINQLEKAQEVVEDRQEYREIYGWFLLAAGIFGGLFIARALAARRVP
jgi:hypothetical protein